MARALGRRVIDVHHATDGVASVAAREPPPREHLDPLDQVGRASLERSTAAGLGRVEAHRRRAAPPPGWTVEPRIEISLGSAGVRRSGAPAPPRCPRSAPASVDGLALTSRNSLRVDHTGREGLSGDLPAARRSRGSRSPTPGAAWSRGRGRLRLLGGCRHSYGQQGEAALDDGSAAMRRECPPAIAQCSPDSSPTRRIS